MFLWHLFIAEQTEVSRDREREKSESTPNELSLTLHITITVLNACDKESRYIFQAKRSNNLDLNISRI